MRKARLFLLDALVRVGLGGTFTQIADHEIRDLAQRVSGLGREYVAPVDELTTAFAESQYQQLARFERVPPVQQARGSVETERQQLIASTLTSEPEWAISLRSNLRLEAQRLEAGSEDAQVVQRQLFAEDLADGRASVWRRGHNNMLLGSQLNIWTLGTGLVALYYLAGQRATGQTWERQAIAAIDERTTDCCLRVHGQVQDLDTSFDLTGTPRFADRVKNPPFHWFCRTSTALYHEGFEKIGASTRDMRDAARIELEARQRTGRRALIHPAYSTSRRA